MMSDDTGSTAQEPFSPEDIRAHSEHDHIAAVFGDRTHAEAAVDELRSLGLGSDHLGVAVHGEGPIAFELDEDADMAHRVEVGAAVGVPIAAVAGIGIVALVAPGLAVGGLLAIGGASALWGLLMGGYAGVAAGGGQEWDEHERLESVRLEPDEVMVVACSHGHADRVHEVLRRHGGRLVQPHHTTA
jgi:hypothetical protein